VQPELALRVLSYALIGYLSATVLLLLLISVGKENRRGAPLGGVIWFVFAVMGLCAVVVLLTAYFQKASSLQKITQRMETVTVKDRATNFRGRSEIDLK
jgi:ABC-type transport system involved in cytochrome bd biosynthesis fused ATPase/permease subunit